MWLLVFLLFFGFVEDVFATSRGSCLAKVIDDLIKTSQQNYISPQLEKALSEMKDEGFIIELLYKGEFTNNIHQVDIDTLNNIMTLIKKEISGLQKEYQSLVGSTFIYDKIDELKKAGDSDALKFWEGKRDNLNRDIKNKDNEIRNYNYQLALYNNEVYRRIHETVPHSSFRTYSVDSPKLQKLKEKGYISKVKIGDASSGDKSGGGINRITKEINMTIRSDSLEPFMMLDHEIVHAKALGKPHRFMINKKSGRRITHPFLFDVYRVKKEKINIVDPYDSFHASEVTAYRASALTSLRRNNPKLALDQLQKSNRAVYKNLEAIKGVRHSLRKGKNMDDFLSELYENTGGPNRIIDDIPCKVNQKGEVTHHFQLNIALDDVENIYLTKEEFLDYLDFLESIHLRVKKSNYKSIERIRKIEN